MPAIPTPRCDLPPFVQLHLAVHDLAQQAFAAPHADGDEIGPGRRVVVVRQPYRPAVMFVCGRIGISVPILVGAHGLRLPWARSLTAAPTGDAAPTAVAPPQRAPTTCAPTASATAFGVVSCLCDLSAAWPAWIRSNSADAGSSFGSWGTSLPSKACFRMACRSRSARRSATSTCFSSSATTDSRRSTSATMRCCSAKRWERQWRLPRFVYSDSALLLQLISGAA